MVTILHMKACSVVVLNKAGEMCQKNQNKFPSSPYILSPVYSESHQGDKNRISSKEE